MLSGFLLRGDADAQQALRILTEATAQIPLAGPGLATLVFGAAGQLDIVYVQHAATATILVWLFVIEHSRRVWPRPTAFLFVLAATGLLSLFVSPGLHDGLEPIVKGPWYFLGLQEILHWTPWPTLAVLGGVAVLAALYAVRVIPASPAHRIKIVLLALAVVYAGLCGVGAFLRGENWAWTPTWPSGAGNARLGWVFARTPDAPATLPAPLPVVMGRPEGCLVCHRGVTGLGNAHSPDAIGCASCHGGDVLTLDKVRAHAGMEPSAGNLATATLRCGQAACHPTIVPRVERSVMTTMSGIVAVNRTVFGEAGAEPAGRRTSGDSAIRRPTRTCGSCARRAILASRRRRSAPTAKTPAAAAAWRVHLSYSPDALAALQPVRSGKTAGRASRLRASIRACRSTSATSSVSAATAARAASRRATKAGTRCTSRRPHSEPGQPGPVSVPRAGRRAGVRAGHAGHPPATRPRLRRLPHGERGHGRRRGPRPQERAAAGHVRGLPCARRARRCPPCRPRRLDPESRRSWRCAQWPGPAAESLRRATRRATSLVNVVDGSGGAPRLVRKRTGERRPLKAAAGRVRGRPRTRTAVVRQLPHGVGAALPYVPHVVRHEGRGVRLGRRRRRHAARGRRSPAPSRPTPPTLGVRRVDAASAVARDVIDTFVPGMVMTLDRNREAGEPSDIVFRRLYARIEPHTTRREARSCESCHNDPEAHRIRPRRTALRAGRVDAAGGASPPRRRRLPARRPAGRRVDPVPGHAHRHGLDARRRAAVHRRGTAPDPARGRVPDVSPGQVGGHARFGPRFRRPRRPAQPAVRPAGVGLNDPYFASSFLRRSSSASSRALRAAILLFCRIRGDAC